MNKEEKHELVLALTEQIKEYGNFYITDTSDLTVAKINDIRRKFFESDITMRVAKNSLIKKAMEAADGDFNQIKMLFQVCNQAEINWQELLKHYKKEVNEHLKVRN